MKITKRSMMTGKINTLEVPCTPEQIERWESGALIQEAMPNVPADLREFLMTGTTPDEWEEMFGSEEEGTGPR